MGQRPIKNQGVIAFVSNGSFIDKGFADGFRKTLGNEFSALYVFNLRGNQRTSGETSRKEGGKIFGQGSRAPIAITLLVKNPTAPGSCQVCYHDIGDCLTREQKLSIIETFGSIDSMPWQTITPNTSGDWINQRDETLLPTHRSAIRGTRARIHCSASTPSALSPLATPGPTISPGR